MLKKSKFLILFCIVCLLSNCGSKVSTQRISMAESDKKALKMTDNWMSQDTVIAISEILKQINNNKGYKRYMAKMGDRQPKIFIAELQNNTSEAYFPIQDLNDELLSKLLESGDFVLIDEAGRDKILKEIQYQNDGMVSTTEAKNIGTQVGADLMIFGNVNMKPEMSDGKTIKEYSVNIRMTDVASGVEIVRARYKFSKFSERKGYSW